MTFRFGKSFAIDGNFLRIGGWELVLVPRLYAAFGAERLLAVHKMARSTYVYLGPHVLSIRRCG